MQQTRKEQQAAFLNGKQVDPNKVGVFLQGKQVSEKESDFLQAPSDFDELVAMMRQLDPDSKEYKVVAQKVAILSSNRLDSSTKDFLGYDPNPILQKDPTAIDFMGGNN
jgi:hypothetical protein